jgi:hypothetical protein
MFLELSGKGLQAVTKFMSSIPKTVQLPELPASLPLAPNQDQSATEGCIPGPRQGECILHGTTPNKLVLLGDIEVISL